MKTSRRSTILPKLHLLHLENLPIFEQLQIEEALLRATHLNVCLINRGSPRAIVMGISGQPELLLDVERVKRDQIPVIQRFSGGGTVIVDENTLFITFVFAKEALPIHPFPEPILRWSGDLYTESWKIPGFHLVENDYAIGDLKCGGNAQYIKKDRWLHHTSFLWDYREENMEYLRQPFKQPKYRENRLHTEFLCRLKDYAPSEQELIDSLSLALSIRFEIISTHLDELTYSSYRQSVRVVDEL